MITVVPVASAALVTVAIMIGTAMPIPAIVSIAMPFGVLVLVAITDPLFLHEIHGSAAGVIASAIVPPVSLVERRNIEVHRRTGDRPGCNDYRLGVDQGWRRIATPNVDLPIDAGLVDADGHADLRIHGRYGASHKCQCYQLFHHNSPEVNST
jgi:hypothetical protein